MNILALIPARAGSKGIERKNLTPFCGRPLLSRAMLVANEAVARGLVSAAALSTDCEQILGAWEDPSDRGTRHVLIRRPPEFATDTSPVIDTVRHALHYLRPREFDAVLLLQPTNPLRNLDDIRGAIALLEAHPEADSVISHIPARCHPARMRYQFDGYQKVLRPHYSEEDFTQGVPRQLLPPVLQRTGEIYLTRTRQIREGRDMEGTFCVPWMQDAARAWDIDEPVDLVIAEALWRAANARTVDA